MPSDLQHCNKTEYFNVEFTRFIYNQDMGFIALFGKLLLVSSIVFQAFLLYHDKKEGDEFNKNLKHAIAQYAGLFSIKQPLQQHLRLVVAGLLGSSALFVFWKFWLAKLPALLGLFTLLWVEHHGIFKQLAKLSNPLVLLDNVSLWHSLGVIGAVIYLLGAERTTYKKSNEGNAAENPAKAAQVSPGKGKPAQKAESKDKKKKN